MSTLLKDKKSVAFIEQDCTIELDGKSFTSGGSYIGKRVDNGKYEGILYASVKTSEVTSWDGKLRIPAKYGIPFYNSLGIKMQYVWFKYNGINFYGLRGCDCRDDIKVKQCNS